MAVWLQGVVPTASINDGQHCGAGGTEFCGNAAGAGVSGALEFDLRNGWTMLGDVTLDYHEEPNSNSGSANDAAAYYGLGVHFINAGAATPWGVMAVIGGGEAAADSDRSPPFAGIGAETMVGDYFVQAGLLATLSDPSGEDGLDNLYFVRGGRAFDMGAGALHASAAIGAGDFEEGDAYDQGYWAQISLEYEAALSGRVNWFAGYQGDYVAVAGKGFSEREQTFAHTFKIGIRIPFGGGTTSAFSTPNFRAPITYAGEFN